MSDADRDVVVKRLQTASAEGRITLDEFGERTRQVYAAQFPSEIEHLTRDLPVPVEATLVEPNSRSAAVATPSGPRQRRRWLVQIMGGANRTGSWDASAPVTSVTMMGGQVIDLTGVDAEVVNITAMTMMGGTEIIVPDGASVDLSGFMLFGGISNNTQAQGDSRMRVHVRAWGSMGGCEVRNLKKKERAKRNL